MMFHVNLFIVVSDREQEIDRKRRIVPRRRDTELREEALKCTCLCSSHSVQDPGISRNGPRRQSQPQTAANVNDGYSGQESVIGLLSFPLVMKYSKCNNSGKDQRRKAGDFRSNGQSLLLC